MTLDFAEHIVLVCGSRTYDNPREVRVQLNLLPEGTWILHGACRGADTLAAEIAWNIGLPTMGIPAKWGLGESYDRGAGFARNRRMLEEFHPQACLAFYDTKELEDSRGTAAMVELAREAGIPVRAFGKGTKLRQLLVWRKEGIL